MAAALVRDKAVVIACLLITSAFAQRQSFKFYGQDQGLSNLATERLYQDRSGYLWVGTQNGLFRYDGAVFVGFGEAEGLPGSSIESIVETPDGVLWVATNRGLARRSGNRFQALDRRETHPEFGTFRARFGRHRSTVSQHGVRSAGLDAAQSWVYPGLRTSARSAIGTGIRRPCRQEPCGVVWLRIGGMPRFRRVRDAVWDATRSAAGPVGRIAGGPGRQRLDPQFPVPPKKSKRCSRFRTGHAINPANQ